MTPSDIKKPREVLEKICDHMIDVSVMANTARKSRLEFDNSIYNITGQAPALLAPYFGGGMSDG